MIPLAQDITKVIFKQGLQDSDFSKLTAGE